jgi:hypothetical protein
VGQTVRKLLTILVLVCFFTTNLTRAFAKDEVSSPSSIALDPAIFSDMDPDDYSKPVYTEEDRINAENFLKVPTTVLNENLFLLKNLFYRVKMEEETHDKASMAKILSKRKDSENIEFELENLGKAEPLVINTERGPLILTKVRHNGTKSSTVFIDIKQIDIQLLEETERLDKLGMTALDKAFEGVSKEQRDLELKYRRILLKKLRVLFAKMLMSEWNPTLEYTPLSELVENKNSDTQSPLAAAPEEVKSHVDAVLNQPIVNLEKEAWFKKLASKGMDLWIDQYNEEKTTKSVNAGNETLTLVFYDGSVGDVLETRIIRRAPLYSFEHWNNYWKAIWEKPAYGEPVWENNKGLGKLKVLLTGDYLMGLSFGVALGSLSFLVSSALPESLPHGLNAFDVARISFGWSLFFGIFSKTWQNFVYRGNDFVRFAKNWSTGLGQSYNFNLMSDESLALIDSGGNFDSNAIKIHTDIVINQSIKTVTKTSLQETPRYRAKTGESDGTIKIKYYKAILPWKNNVGFMQFEVVENTIDPLKLYRWVREQFSIEEFVPGSWEDKFVLRFKKDIKISLPWLVPAEWETYVPRKNLEGQMPQLVTTPVGLLSRFGFTVAGVPLGHLLYAILGPVGEVRQISYKRRYANELAKKYGENHALTRRVRKMVEMEIQNWNALKINNIPGTQFIGYYTKVVPKQVLETAQKLADYLTRKVAYLTYQAYDDIQTNLKNAEENRKLNQAETDRMNLLMTVRNDKGQVHPVQIANDLRNYGAFSCARLFN